MLCLNAATITSATGLTDAVNSNLTGSAAEHMLESAYIRNGTPDAKFYTINDSLLDANRITLASLLSLTSSVYFNKFLTIISLLIYCTAALMD